MERERVVVTGLLVLLLLLWLGFAVHRSPQFPGSLLGTLLGIAGALLMVLPSLVYAAVKRLPSLKRRVNDRMPLRSLLTWHVWGGILGAVLAILHSAHRFESTLSVALAGVMLIVIFSGYVGRHFLGKVSLELREKQALLEQLMNAYNAFAGEIASRPQQAATVVTTQSPWSRMRRRVGLSRSAPDSKTNTAAERAAELAESIADLEYGIQTDELMKRRFKTWLILHIVTAAAFYALLALHIWASLYFGLRWLA
jgi:hypothetical protein